MVIGVYYTFVHTVCGSTVFSQYEQPIPALIEFSDLCFNEEGHGILVWAIQAHNILLFTELFYVSSRFSSHSGKF